MMFIFEASNSLSISYPNYIDSVSVLFSNTTTQIQSYFQNYRC